MITHSKSQNTPIIMLFAMFFLALITSSVKLIAFTVGVYIFIYGLYKTVTKRNQNGEAHFYAGFIIGAEVYFRMSFAGLPWEFAKIASSILFFFALLVENKKKDFSIILIIYPILFVPSLFIPDWQDLNHFKHDLMFNLSGQIALTISIFYFYNRKISTNQLIQFLRVLIYGVSLMAFMVLIKNPDYSSIEYGGGSNFEASGGFGPNQVTTVLGLGVFILGFSLVQKLTLFKYKIIDLFLFIMFILQGLFTLSRGGLFSSSIALVISILAIYIIYFKKAHNILKINPFKVLLTSLVIIVVFWEADSISGGAIAKRYFNEDEFGQQVKEDYSTHREGIAKRDFETFLENWETGVGMGGSAYFRKEEIGIGAVHVEHSRILADHGILGVIALLILFTFPIVRFFNSSKNLLTKFLLSSFVALAFLTMSHNAMRLAMVGFFYGAGFMIVKKEKIKKEKIKKLKNIVEGF